MRDDSGPLSDAGLIARALAGGEKHAFRQLVLRHQSAVRRWSRRLMDSASDGDDLAQETFLKAWRSLHQYRGHARFTTWLYRIAFNLAASRRRLAAARWESVDWDEQAERVAVAAAPGSEANASDLQRDFDAALGTLAESQQWVLRLSLQEGLSHEEIAAVLDLPLGTVKTHALRGKQKLRELLAPWQELQP